jgi:hypothetical protein
VHASDTDASGGNVAAWLWFFGSFVVFLVSSVTLVVMAARPPRRQSAP